MTISAKQEPIGSAAGSVGIASSRPDVAPVSVWRCTVHHGAPLRQYDANESHLWQRTQQDPPLLHATSLSRPFSPISLVKRWFETSNPFFLQQVTASVLRNLSWRAGTLTYNPSQRRCPSSSPAAASWGTSRAISPRKMITELPCGGSIVSRSSSITCARLAWQLSATPAADTIPKVITAPSLVPKSGSTLIRPVRSSCLERKQEKA